jgi:transposase
MGTAPTRRRVSVNDRGHVVGQDHHRAKFSNHDIDLMIELHADGMSYLQIAIKFETSKFTVRDYVKGRRRGHTAVGQKTLAPPAARRRFKAAHVDEFEVCIAD